MTEDLFLILAVAAPWTLLLLFSMFLLLDMFFTKGSDND